MLNVPQLGFLFEAANMYDDGQLKFPRLAVNMDRDDPSSVSRSTVGLVWYYQPNSQLS